MAQREDTPLTQGARIASTPWSESLAPYSVKVATLAAIRQALAEYSSPRVQVRETIVHRASVAVILAGLPHELRACFIRRAERPADRWSGQMAFPGGHREAQDADLTATAQRETLEEIGLSLETAERLGELSESPIAPRRRGEAGILSAFVFYIGRDQPPLTPNAEVAATYWIPIDHLWAPENRTTVEWGRPRRQIPPPRRPIRDPSHLGAHLSRTRIVFLKQSGNRSPPAVQ